jgi:hypothetical protein
MNSIQDSYMHTDSYPMHFVVANSFHKQFMLLVTAIDKSRDTFTGADTIHSHQVTKHPLPEAILPYDLLAPYRRVMQLSAPKSMLRSSVDLFSSNRLTFFNEDNFLDARIS